LDGGNHVPSVEECDDDLDDVEDYEYDDGYDDSRGGVKDIFNDSDIAYYCSD
jgi:hypothetical protein